MQHGLARACALALGTRDRAGARRFSFGKRTVAVRGSVDVSLFTERNARIDGFDLHWVEMGTGPPVVLVHGLADTHRTWRRVLPELAKTRRVLALDLPGHGMSGRPDASYSIDWHAAALRAWCDQLGLDGFDLIGHSYGGGVAMYALLEHGHKVRRLGLVAAGGLGREVSWGLRLAALPVGPRLMQPFMKIGSALGAQIIARDAFTAEDRRWLAEANAQPGSARAFARTVRGVIGLRGQTMHFLDHGDRIRRLPPVKLFWGERDPIVPIAHGEHALTFLAGAELTRFRRSGHFPHLSQPDLFCNEVLRFLSAPDVPAVTIDGAAAAAKPATPKARLATAGIRRFRRPRRKTG